MTPVAVLLIEGREVAVYGPGWHRFTWTIDWPGLFSWVRDYLAEQLRTREKPPEVTIRVELRKWRGP